MPPRRSPQLKDQAAGITDNGRNNHGEEEYAVVTHDDPETVFHALHNYKWMRRRDRPAFLCQLSATLTNEQKRAVLRQLRPLLSHDVAISVAGPAPNLSSYNPPFLGEVKGLKSPWVFEEDKEDDSDDEDYRFRRRKPTPEEPVDGESVVAMANTSPSEPEMATSGTVELIGPLKFRPHVHRTTPAVRSADLTTAQRERLDSAMASVTITQRRGLRDYAARRRRIPAPEKVDLLCDTSILVTYHLRKTSYREPEEAVWRARHECQRKAGLLEREEEKREDHSQKLFKLFSKLSQGDCWRLAVHVMCNWLRSPEATEYAMYFTDCIRQRLNERSFWERVPQDVIVKFLLMLRPHDVCRAAGVCKNWYNILNFNLHMRAYWRRSTTELGKAYQIDDLPRDIEKSKPHVKHFTWRAEYHRWEKTLREPPKTKELHKMNPSRLELLMLIFRTAAWKIGREAFQKSAEIMLEKAAQDETSYDGHGAIALLPEARVRSLMATTLIKAKHKHDDQTETGEDDAEADDDEADGQSQSREASSKVGHSSSTSPTDDENSTTEEPNTEEEKPKAKPASPKLPPLPSVAFEMRLGTTPEKLFKESIPYKLAKQKVERGLLRPIEEMRVRNTPRPCPKMSLVRQIASPSAGGVSCVCLDRRRIICGSVDGSIRIWSIASARFISSYKPHKGSVRCIDTHDELIASGSWDTSIFVYHAVRCEVVNEVTGHTGTVASIRLTDRFLITGSGDCTLRLWSTATWQLLSVLTGHKDEIAAICTLEAAWPSNAMLATASADGSVRRWDFTFLEAGSTDASQGRRSAERRPAGSRRRQVSELQPPQVAGTSNAIYGQPCPLLCMQVMGGLMVVGDMQGWVTFIDWREERVTERIRAHAQAVLSLDIAEEWLVTCGLGRLVRQWSLKTGQCVRQLAGHSNAIRCVKWLGDDIVTASLDRSARIWTDTDPFSLVQSVMDEEEEDDDDDDEDAFGFGSAEEDKWVAMPVQEPVAEDVDLWDDIKKKTETRVPEFVPVRSPPEFRDESKRIEVKQAIVMHYDTCEPFLDVEGPDADAALLKFMQLESGIGGPLESV